MAGLVPRTGDWRGELDWVGRDGIILFEAVSEGYGALQDRLRAEGHRVIGGSAGGGRGGEGRAGAGGPGGARGGASCARLESARAYAQEVLAGLGLQIAAVHEFDTASAGDAFLTANPGRYVPKLNGPAFASSATYV